MLFFDILDAIYLLLPEIKVLLLFIVKYRIDKKVYYINNILYV